MQGYTRDLHVGDGRAAQHELDERRLVHLLVTQDEAQVGFGHFREYSAVSPHPVLVVVDHRLPKRARPCVRLVVVSQRHHAGYDRPHQPLHPPPVAGVRPQYLHDQIHGQLEAPVRRVGQEVEHPWEEGRALQQGRVDVHDAYPALEAAEDGLGRRHVVPPRRRRAHHRPLAQPQHHVRRIPHRVAVRAQSPPPHTPAAAAAAVVAAAVAPRRRHHEAARVCLLGHAPEELQHRRPQMRIRPEHELGHVGETRRPPHVHGQSSDGHGKAGDERPARGTVLGLSPRRVSRVPDEVRQ